MASCLIGTVLAFSPHLHSDAELPLLGLHLLRDLFIWLRRWMTILDLQRVLETDYDSGLPTFLGGHSMGSLASIHVALRDQAAWSGVILGTATVDVEWNWLLRYLALAPLYVYC